MSWDAFTVVSLEPPPLDVVMPHVGINHFANVSRCWHELTDRGLSRVGLITREEHYAAAAGQSIAAHAFSQSRTASPFDQIPNLTLGRGNEAAQISAWIEEHRPDAVIGCAPVHHLLVDEVEVTVPHDLCYISLDIAAEKHPNVSGINANNGVVGETVIDTLNHLLQRGITGAAKSPVGTHVSGAWQEGETLATMPLLAQSG